MDKIENQVVYLFLCMNQVRSFTFMTPSMLTLHHHSTDLWCLNSFLATHVLQSIRNNMRLLCK